MVNAMKYIIYYVAGLLILSVAPALIMGAVYTAGFYYILYILFKGITSGGSGSSGSSGGSSHEPDPGDGCQGTGNPYV